MDVYDSYKIGESLRMKIRKVLRTITGIILTVALSTGLMGCGEEANVSLVKENTTESEIVPVTKADGSRFRLAYVDYDEYLPASRQLYYILKGLEEAGWIKEGGIPFEINGLDKIFARIEGKDYIPVVPIYESTFFGDCIHLPKGDAEALVAKETIWEFDEYKLKNSID